MLNSLRSRSDDFMAQYLAHREVKFEESRALASALHLLSASVSAYNCKGNRASLGRRRQVTGSMRLANRIRQRISISYR
jgi:hypothetical protein